jgi:ligand-binding sensor domain-containing protein
MALSEKGRRSGCCTAEGSRKNGIKAKTTLILSLFISGAVLSPSNSFAQNQAWTILNRENTLFPGSHARDIITDKDGVQWMTSNRGVIKFNGKDWTIYNKENSGLPDNTIFSIVFDKNNTLWIASITGITKYDGQKWTVVGRFGSSAIFDTLHLDDPLYSQKVLWDSSLLGSSNYISDIAVDFQGNLWVGIGQNPGGNGGGLFKFNGNDWISFDSTNSGLPGYFLVTFML